MNLVDFNWNDYKIFTDYLYSLKDDKYALFHEKLNGGEAIIGISIPILKNIAKEISKGNYLTFIKNNSHQTYEEILLHGLVITYLKEEFNYTLKLFDEYIKYINSWASCDYVVCNYKLFKKNLDIGFIKIKEYINSDNPWIKRVGIVLLLANYVNEVYIDLVLDIANNIITNDYYVQMANAWLISVCLVKFYDKTYIFLLNDKLDDFTHNKAIQKGIESFRVSNKDELRKLKRK